MGLLLGRSVGDTVGRCVGVTMGEECRGYYGGGV